MSVLEASVLYWFQFQFSQETVMDMNTNPVVWMYIELAHGIVLRFQYSIVFGCQTLELHSNISICIKTVNSSCMTIIG